MRNPLAGVALAALLLIAPASAQEHGKSTCLTVEVMTNRAKAADKEISVYYTLRDIDIGFEDPVDVTIYTNGHEYIAAAFAKGCYVDFRVMSETEVLAFLNQFTKKAISL